MVLFVLAAATVTAEIDFAAFELDRHRLVDGLGGYGTLFIDRYQVALFLGHLCDELIGSLIEPGEASFAAYINKLSLIFCPVLLAHGTAAHGAYLVSDVLLLG